MLTNERMEMYIKILEEELQLATGCTEPIAIAHCAAILKQVLGVNPDRILAEVSGNIIKNVKSVVVPNTDGRRGIGAAIAAGIVAGDAAKELQVIASIPDDVKPLIASYEESTPIDVSCLSSPYMLDIQLTGWVGIDSATVRIANNHNNVVFVKHNDTVLLEKVITVSAEDSLTDKSVLNVRDILTFARTVDLSRVLDLLEQQIECNIAIAEEGLRGDWGASIGKVLLNNYGDDIRTMAKAYAAAGSDARMSGCDLPVVIVSGSGNQGITASVPVVCYAKHIKASQEQLYRALLVSNLITIHQKTGIGRLSAYCGAISAGVGAGAGIAFMLKGDYETVAHTIVNAVVILSGTICDGAKPSCAAKIAAAVDAGIMGYEMYSCKKQFFDGDGIVRKGVDNTIENIGKLASEGMASTDRTILELMIRDGSETCV